MPTCMEEGRINMCPTPRIIDQNHESDGHATKNINRIYTPWFSHSHSLVSSIWISFDSILDKNQFQLRQIVIQHNYN